MQRGSAITALGATARAVMSELVIRGELPRADLARSLGLSPSSLTKATKELLEAGLITQQSRKVSDVRGRPGAPLAIVAEQSQFIGVKVTGDAVFVVRVDALGVVRESAERALSTHDVEPVVAEIVALVNEMASGSPVQAIGVGMAGRMARFDDHVRHNLYLGWDEVPLSDLIERGTGIPTVISNDLRALTAGAQWWGPGKRYSDFAVVSVGVGLGVCPVIDGTVRSGARGAAGLVGHQRVAESGPLCERGHRGCANTFLTTAAITRSVAAAHGIDVTLEQVVAMAHSGDPVAARVVAEAGGALGTIIADLCNLLDLSAVVITGDGVAVIEAAGDSLDRAMTERIDPFAHRPTLELWKSDFDAWAHGAAVVACQWLLLAAPRTPHHSTRTPQHDLTHVTKENSA